MSECDTKINMLKFNHIECVICDEGILWRDETVKPLDTCGSRLEKLC